MRLRFGFLGGEKNIRGTMPSDNVLSCGFCLQRFARLARAAEDLGELVLDDLLDVRARVA